MERDAINRPAIRKDGEQRRKKYPEYIGKPVLPE
jgi:hypothetical protein